MIRRTSIAALIAAFLGVSVVWFLSLRAAIRPVERTAKQNFSAESVSRGEALAAAGYCASCHTRAGGPALAGGYGVNTPFGIIYGTNITPDPETGIGLWSLAIEFLPSTEAPVGLGEPPTTAVAPAIGNAIFAATGARIRHIPIRPEAVLEALRMPR
jgi:hypothetical protein